MAAICHSADFHARVKGQGAAGSFIGTVILRNVSGRACHTEGYPGVALGRLGVSFLKVRAGHRVRFSFRYPEVGKRCRRRAHVLRVIAPDDVTALRIHTTVLARPCGEGTVQALRA